MRMALMQIQEVEPATTCIFVEADKLLEELDYQRALSHVSRLKKERYRSRMDYLFCEIFVEHRTAAFRFYNGEGPPAKDYLTQEEIQAYDVKLCEVLNWALDFWKADTRMNWTQFRFVCLQRWGSGT